jgi:3-oxoadipate enol-lactonase
MHIHYQWQGKADGPVLVLINGLLTDLSSWNGHLPAYVDKFHVLTYDCRGQGQSDKPEDGPYTPKDHADDLRQLLGDLKIEKAALLGVSNGACVALQFAAEHPDRVTALVLANAYGRADTAMKVKLTSWLNGMAAGGGPLRFDISSPWIWGASYLNKNYEALKPWREKGSALPVFAVRNLIAGGMEMDVLDLTPNITCPTLFLTGDEDVLTTLNYAHELQRRIRGSQIVMLREAGHCMFLEQPAQFTRAAAEFLTRALL